MSTSRIGSPRYDRVIKLMRKYDKCENKLREACFDIDSLNHQIDALVKNHKEIVSLLVDACHLIKPDNEQAINFLEDGYIKEILKLKGE